LRGLTGEIDPGCPPGTVETIRVSRGGVNALLDDLQIAGLFEGVGIGDEVRSFPGAKWRDEQKEKDEGKNELATKNSARQQAMYNQWFKDAPIG
jgi:hypothetical protein